MAERVTRTAMAIEGGTHVKRTIKVRYTELGLGPPFRWELMLVSLRAWARWNRLVVFETIEAYPTDPGPIEPATYSDER